MLWNKALDKQKERKRTKQFLKTCLSKIELVKINFFPEIGAIKKM